MDHATVLAAATHASTSARAEGAAIAAAFLVCLAFFLRARGRRTEPPAPPKRYPPRGHWRCRRCRDVGSLTCGACRGKGADVGCGCMTGYVPCRACEPKYEPSAWS